MVLLLLNIFIMRIYRRAGKYAQKKLFLKKFTLFSSPLTSRDPGAHTRVKHVYLGNNVRELVFVNFHRQLKKGQYFKINSTKLRNLAEILFLSLFSQWNPQNESCRKEFCDKIIFLMKAVFLKKIQKRFDTIWLNCFIKKRVTNRKLCANS